MPTLPVGYFSLAMDINSKPVFLLQLKSWFFSLASSFSVLQSLLNLRHTLHLTRAKLWILLGGSLPPLWLLPHLNIQPRILCAGLQRGNP